MPSVCRDTFFCCRHRSLLRWSLKVGSWAALISILWIGQLQHLCHAAGQADPLQAELAAKAPLLPLELKQRLRDAVAMNAEVVGLWVWDLDRKVPVFGHNPDRLMVPASNIKLLTTAAALDGLGPHYQFTTEIWGRLGPQGIIEGNLYVRGFGDPFLTPERLWALGQRLHYLGIRKIRGDIVIDDAYFAGPRLAGGWKEDTSSAAYMAPTGAVSVGFNAIRVHIKPQAPGKNARIQIEPASDHLTVHGHIRSIRRGRARLQVRVLPQGERSAVHLSGTILSSSGPRGVWRRIDNPPMFAGDVLRRILRDAGISSRGVHVGTLPADTGGQVALITALHSPPLGELVNRVNQFSNNFMASQLARALGAHMFGPPGTWDKGQKAIQTFLANKVGIPPESYTVINGSGLHTQNQLTPRQLVQVLESMYHRRDVGFEYIASLAVAGRSGTLGERMSQGPAAGVLRAKTGTLSVASALAGYVPAHSGQMLAFAILVNNFRSRIPEIWQAQNSIGDLLARAQFSTSPQETTLHPIDPGPVTKPTLILKPSDAP